MTKNIAVAKDFAIIKVTVIHLFNAPVEKVWKA